jgi:hypothetical protein
MNPSYNPQRWHQFLIYIGYNLFACLVNAFLSILLPIIDKAAFICKLHLSSKHASGLAWRVSNVSMIRFPGLSGAGNLPTK